MKTYFEDVKSFIKNRTYFFSVLLIAIISFGYAVFNSSISIDDIEYDRYVGSGNVMLTSGRFGLWFWAFIQGKWETSYIIDIVAVIFLVFSVINFSLLFKRISNHKIKSSTLTMFSCVFISYPLMLEIWEYTGANVSICGSYTLVSLTLILIYEYIHNNSSNKFWNLFPSALMMMLVCAGYESVVSVYLFFVFAILALQIVYGNDKEKTFFEILKQFSIYIGVLVVGLLLRFFVHKLYLLIFGLEATANGATDILWGTSPIKDIVINLIIKTISRYIFKGIIYFPITIFVLCLFIFIVFGFFVCKKHGFILLLPGLGMLFSLIALSIIQGTVSPYRTCQVFAAFVAFTIMILLTYLQNKFKLKWVNILSVILCGFLCFYQATYINYFLELNHRRSEYESNVICKIGMDLYQSFDTSKPVIFVGTYTLNPDIVEAASISSESLNWKMYNKIYSTVYRLLGYENKEIELSRKLPETNVNSLIDWAIVAYDQESMNKLFSYFGYAYTPADFKTVYRNALDYAVNSQMPAFPSNGYIADIGEVIIVNLK